MTALLWGSLSSLSQAMAKKVERLGCFPGEKLNQFATPIRRRGFYPPIPRGTLSAHTRACSWCAMEMRETN